jgi:hypothetical protein
MIAKDSEAAALPSKPKSILKKNFTFIQLLTNGDADDAKIRPNTSGTRRFLSQVKIDEKDDEKEEQNLVIDVQLQGVQLLDKKESECEKNVETAAVAEANKQEVVVGIGKNREKNKSSEINRERLRKRRREAMKKHAKGNKVYSTAVN